MPATAWGGDPKLRWYTLETEHFRVHYHGGLEQQAQRTARYAEALEARLVVWLGRQPRERTELVLSDSSDSSNGFANVMPYSTVRLYVTAPDDMSDLGDYDDWLPTLTAHELTHIVHLDDVAGAPAFINAVLGKTAVPNQLQPRWLTEGLAVLAETRLSGVGRLRSTTFEMALRADALEGNLAQLDEITSNNRRWPGGNLPYLYGAKFCEYLEQVYGPALFEQASREASDKLIPFGISRPFYRATRRTLEELYEGFHKATYQRVRQQMEQMVGPGWHEGKRLTHHGRATSSPRFVPAHCRAGDSDELVYFRDDGSSTSGAYRFSLDSAAEDARLLARSTGDTVAFTPDCSMVFESVAPSQRRYAFSDLHLQPADTESPTGLESSRIRLTVGRRARDPDVSPDGKWVTYVTDRAGTTTLRVARWDGRNLGEERTLSASGLGEQVFVPQFSPDSRYVALGTWRHGGYRDLRVIELATGRAYSPWLDRAVDRQPTWSPDGRWLYYCSDRTGISNIFALELATGKTRQITHVRTGAFMPTLSPDGKQLVYVGYTSAGYDLFQLPLEPALSWQSPQPTRDYAAPLTVPEGPPLEIHPYSPLATLRPHALGVDYRSDRDGVRLTTSVVGGDVVGNHQAQASVVFEPEGAQPDLYLSYAYRRLPFHWVASGYRISDYSSRYEYGTLQARLPELRQGLVSSAVIPLPGEFDDQEFRLGYDFGWVSSVFPTGTAADPYASLPTEPRRDAVSRMRASYSFSNTETYLYSVGRERGVSVFASVERSDRRLGGELDGTSAYAQASGYIPVPVGRHTVLAVSAAIGASDGAASRGWSLGGAASSELLTAVLDGVGRSRFALRGFPAGAFEGSRVALGQTELRFPLFFVERGVSTLPVFLRGVSAAIGADYGGAFSQLPAGNPWEAFHLGWGGELWFDVVFGYRQPLRWGLGYAKGQGELAWPGGTTYFSLVSPL